jgi:hypothetical protein
VHEAWLIISARIDNAKKPSASDLIAV